MGTSQGRDRFGARLLLLLTLAPASGCMSCFNPVAPPPPEWVATCCGLPRMERNHVYIFFMNGHDPLNGCNLTGVRDCIQKLGFIKTYYGEPRHFYWFVSEIRRLSAEDPNARFVLVGSQYGANLLAPLACEVSRDGVTIDLAFYLDRGLLHCAEHTKPDNILRAVNVWSGHAILKAKKIPGADNVCIPDANMLGCGTHAETLERLALELSVVAASIPVETTDSPEPEQAPMPSLSPQLPPLAEEWSFLNPKPKLAGIPRMEPIKTPQSGSANAAEQLSDTSSRSKQ